jgi:hypothetical protein
VLVPPIKRLFGSLFEKKIEFPLCKNDLYQVLIEIDLLVLEKTFSNIKMRKNSFPIAALKPPGNHALNKLEFALCQEGFT